MPSAPTGTVTMVFTDIQGSTALWERFGDRFGSALALHHQILREQIASHNGYEVKTEGDAFMVAFSEPAEAACFCAATQEALHNAAWATDLLNDISPIAAARTTMDGSHRGIRVRMGIHTGRPTAAPDPQTGRMDYVGRMVNKAARIARAGHGGQILMSSRTFEQAKDLLQRDALAIRDLGEHALRGIPGRERIWQVLPDSLQHRRFPPIKTPRIRRTNLLVQTNRLFGRSEELAALEDHLQAGTRLITLIGPSGVGKRRLATEFGFRQLEIFSGGAWATDLSETQDLGQVCSAVASALDLTVTQPDPVAQIGNALLGRGPVLLLLFDLHTASSHVSDAIEAWLRRAPDARVVITALQPMLIPDEQILPLDPLPATVSANMLREWSGTPDLDTSSLSEMLEGLPLGLELVANLIARNGPTDVASALMAQPVPRGLPPISTALRRAILLITGDLSDAERKALGRLSIFSGGFPTAAAAVVGATEALEVLADRRLIRPSGPDRWTMSPAISEIAIRTLAQDRDQLLAAEGAHGSWAADLARQAVQRQDRRILVIERENLLAANVRAADRQDGDIAGATGIGLVTALQWHGPPEAALSVSTRTLAVEDLSLRDHADLLRLRSLSFHFLGEQEDADADLREAEELARTIDDPAVAAEIYLERGSQLDDQGMVELALASYQSSLDAFHASEDPGGEGRAIAAMGNLAAKRGEIDAAMRLYTAALAQHRRIGDPYAEGAVLSNLAIVTTIADRTAEARELFRDALAIHRELGDRRGEAVVLGNLGDLYLQTHDLEIAITHLNSALLTAREVGDRQIEGCFSGSLGEAKARIGQLTQARSLMARAERLLREVGDTYELIRLICRRGHVELEGRYPERSLVCLQQAETYAAKLSLGPETKPHQAIEELRAQLENKGLTGAGGATPAR